jgi:C7-cyclitol 7-kinase
VNVVFDLGGTYLRSGIDRGAGPPCDVERLQINAGSADETGRVWETVALAMEDYILRKRRAYGCPRTVVVAFPGPIGAEARPLCAPTVGARAAAVPDFVRVLSQAAAAPVYLLNDVSAAAWYLGERTVYERFIVVTVSSGIGSKFYDRNRTRPVLDDESFCGEIGHVTVDRSPEAALCDCGSRGHLGAVASARGIQRRARQAAIHSPEFYRTSRCAQTCKHPSRLTNESDLVPAAKLGDPWVWSIIEEATLPLGWVLADAAQLCGPQRVILIGGFACALGDRYAGVVEAAMRQRLAPAQFGALDKLVEVCDDADDSCLRGAACFARTRGSVAECVS